MSTRYRMVAGRCAALALVGLGCSSDGAADRPSTVRQLVISDQLHNGGTTGFVFLPPMVPRPAYFGDFLPDLEPLVRVDEVRPDGSTIRTLATFTRDSGPGRERIRVHHQDRPCDADDTDGDTDPNGYFYARWWTHNAHLSLNGLYRVRVFVQERVHPCTRSGWGRRCRHAEDRTAPLREIGYADVDVVRNAREFRGVDRGEYVPLVNGHTLRIKFRIDRPVVDADGDGVYNWRDNCRDTANASQLDTDRDGEGDACECLAVTCAASDACHVAGTCSPTDGRCSNPASADGTACVLSNATAACAAGACGVTSCNAGFANCNGTAADGCETATNTLTNCGACGAACASGPNSTPTCGTGACGLVCNAGWADLDGDRANGCELDLNTDANCGAPGNACVSDTTGTTTCVAGACTTMSCATGTANCNTSVGDGCEVSLTGDVSNCGACGHTCATPNGSPACAAGACAVGACNTGFADCNAAAADGCEVDARSDVRNCGACGNACALAHAAPVCAAGRCAVATCDAGFADVDGDPANGCEVNLSTDPAHCGAPGNACSASNGTAACAGGACAIASCDAGYANCDGAVGSGCEVHTAADTSNCGACGVACASGAHSAATCAAGACGLRCDAGFADVDGAAANGCETDLGTDSANCGAVGNACTAGRTCIGGGCSAAVCVTGSANCNGAEGDGCEVNTTSDPAHCGTCGAACAFPNAAPECTAGACGFSVCNSGFGDCDGTSTNGCEVNVAADTSNCGGCGVTCAAANGASTCVAGVCGLGECNPNFANCDGSVATGCEVNTGRDINNCGACGNACPTVANATNSCSRGLCRQACNAGFENCDGDITNGCEASLTTPSNCGACGVVCATNNGTPTCAGGACAVGSCNAGFADCNGSAADGCEVNTTNNTANCGGCGVTCTAANGASTCVAGVCGLGHCASGFANCDGSVATGCEVNTRTDLNHCGACGNACPTAANAARSCASGSCGFTCNAGFANCDGNAANGCETAGTCAPAVAGYLYLPRMGSTVSRCDVNADGSLGACALAAGGFTHAYGVTVNGGYAYIADDQANTLTRCTIGAGGALTSCANSGVAGLQQPTQLAVSGSTAYIANSFGYITACTISIGDGSLSGCSTMASFGGPPNHLHGIAVSGGQVYTTRYFQGRLERCVGASCTTAVFDSGPIGVTFSGGRAYYSGLNFGYVKVCNLDGAGSFTGCASTGGGFNQPMGMIAVGAKMYIANFAGGYLTTCTIGAGGVLAGCTNGPALGGNLGYPGIFLLP
ncbi:MAG: hypothetical protein HY909_12430 [Deltaproteobacteria bacterium]|nr:hypothetical protein [Deltaproteobacteria bacterium]